MKQLTQITRTEAIKLAQLCCTANKSDVYEYIYIGRRKPVKYKLLFTNSVKFYPITRIVVELKVKEEYLYKYQMGRFFVISPLDSNPFALYNITKLGLYEVPLLQKDLFCMFEYLNKRNFKLM